MMPFALITGGSKGIGKCIATELAKRKYPVLLVARDEKSLQEHATTLSNTYGVVTHYLALDLGKVGATQILMNWIDSNNYPVGILVNNAGYGLSGPFTKYNAEAHIEMMRVNMEVPVALTAALLPMLTKNAPAYILNIASSAAYQAVPGLSVYAASKSFVLSFSRGLRHELKNTGVSVTAVSPGSTDTNFANRADVGAKALKTAEKVNMTPEAVAEIAITALFDKKPEVITGFINKLGAFFVWLLPKKLAESIAAGLYGL
jgi:short-subunit dehydrogenase